MSTKGIIGGVIGGVAGFIVGGPMGAVVGFGLGMGIGMMLDPLEPDTADTPGQGQINKFEIPTANLGDPLPDFIGTVKIAGNIIQSWGHRVVELTEEQMTPGGKAGGGGEGQTVVVGYEHYLSLLIAFAYGEDPAYALHTVLFDDKVVWYDETGTGLTDDDVDGEETIQLGGPSGEDLGSMTLYFGRSDQSINADAAAALDDPTLATAYRGLVYAHFDDVMIGSYARAPSIKIVVSKFPSIAAIEDSDLRIVNTLDYNPAYAIWYLSEKHVGMDTSFLNAASFLSCANYFKSTDFPGVGISMLLNRQVVASTYIDGIMSHVGASLVEIDGELNLGVLRNDVDVANMESITDNEALEIPSLTVGSWEDTYNDVKVIFSKINHVPALFTYDCGDVSLGNEFDPVGNTSIRELTWIMDDIYLLSYMQGTSGSLIHKTFRIEADGTINTTPLDTYTFPSSIWSNPSVEVINRSVYGYVAAGYCIADGTFRLGVHTLRIDALGQISLVDQQIYSVNAGSTQQTFNQLVNMQVGSIFIYFATNSQTTFKIDLVGNITSTYEYTRNTAGNPYSLPYCKRLSSQILLVSGGIPGCTGISFESFYVQGSGQFSSIDTYDSGLTSLSRGNFITNPWTHPYVSPYQGVMFCIVTTGNVLQVHTLDCNNGYFAAALTDSLEVDSSSIYGQHTPIMKLGENEYGNGSFVHYHKNTFSWCQAIACDRNGNLSKVGTPIFTVNMYETSSERFGEPVRLMGSEDYNDAYIIHHNMRDLGITYETRLQIVYIDSACIEEIEE